MFEHKAVQIRPVTRRAVLQFLQHSGDGRDVEQVVDAALQAWLASAAVADPKAAMAATRGYQWKSLFLPEGTLLRVQYGDQYAVAAISGDHLVYQGRRYSPRQFVMHVTGQVRNAWQALWIRSPDDARWHLADTRRRILRRAPRPVDRADRADLTKPVPPPAPRLSSQQAWRDHRRQAYLRRSDCVLDEQADLSIRLPAGRGYGPFGAGRAGPRDRRAPARFSGAP